MAASVTTICAAVTGITWCCFDYIFTRRASSVSFCSGVVTGLVVITPASGYVAPWASLVIGILSGVLINLACRIKGLLGFDDVLGMR